jgi:competence protein ComEA
MASIAAKITDKTMLEWVMQNSDIDEVVARDQQYIEITMGKMKVRERVLLGIPFDPYGIKPAGWESLPGIGPGLAKSIMADRHNNGAFVSAESLQRVPVSEKRS